MNPVAVGWVHQAGWLVFSIRQNPEVGSNASEGRDRPARASFLLSSPLYRLPAGGVAQTKGGSSHLKRFRLKVLLLTSNYLRKKKSRTGVVSLPFRLFPVKLTTKNSHRINYKDGLGERIFKHFCSIEQTPRLPLPPNHRSNYKSNDTKINSVINIWAFGVCQAFAGSGLIRTSGRLDHSVNRKANFRQCRRHHQEEVNSLGW